MIDKIFLKFKSILEMPKRVLGPYRNKKFRNIENYSEYFFELPRHNAKRGVSCMLRAKNESAKIIKALESIEGILMR